MWLINSHRKIGTEAFLSCSGLCWLSAPPVTHTKRLCQQVTIMGLQHIKAMDRKLHWALTLFLSPWTPAIYNLASFINNERVKKHSAPRDIKHFRIVPSTHLPDRGILCTVPLRHSLRLGFKCLPCRVSQLHFFSLQSCSFHVLGFFSNLFYFFVVRGEWHSQTSPARIFIWLYDMLLKGIV